MGKIKITDVAKLAGVSISTVSRVLNNNAKVDASLKNRVNDAIARLNYSPNIHARRIKAGKSGVLGIILPMVSNPFFAEILEGALRAAWDHNIRLLVFSEHGDAQKELDCLRAAVNASVDGIIYCPVAEHNAQQAPIILPEGMPLIIAARQGVIVDVPHVYQDNVKGGYIATKYLLRLGRRSIAFFAGFWQSSILDVDELLVIMASDKRGSYSSLDRLYGYIQALEESAIPFDKNLIQITGYDYKSGYDCTKIFLSKMKDFDSAICANDYVASGMMCALREQNINVPHDVSVIGYDDGVVAPIAMPSLTSVHQQPRVIGFHAVTMMIDLLDKKPVNDFVVDTTLSIRNSTASTTVSK